MARASIDLGSNTALLLVLDDAGRVLQDEARIVGLGRGLGDGGSLRPDRAEAALEVLRDFARMARTHGVAPGEVCAAATSAGRRARDFGNFQERVRAETGLVVQVIAGEEEARLTWLGGRWGLQLPPRVALVDLGGGSTEVVSGLGDLILFRASIEVGSVRLTEKWFGETPGRYPPGGIDRLRDEVAAAFASVRDWPRPEAAVAVAGTATTLMAMEIGLDRWDAAQVHGSLLTRAALGVWISRLAGSKPEERRHQARVSPERADFLLAGACVLDAAASALGVRELIASDGGLRHGLVAAPSDRP